MTKPTVEAAVSTWNLDPSHSVAEFKIKQRRKLKSTSILTVLSSKRAIDNALQGVLVDKQRKCLLQNYLCFSRGDVALRLQLK